MAYRKMGFSDSEIRGMTLTMLNAFSHANYELGGGEEEERWATQDDIDSMLA